MENEKRAREFWIIKDGVNRTFRGVVDKKPSGISGGGSNQSIHVIEYVHYELALKLAETATEGQKLATVANQLNFEKYKDGIDALKKENQRLLARVAQLDEQTVKNLLQCHRDSEEINRLLARVQALESALTWAMGCMDCGKCEGCNRRRREALKDSEGA